MTSPAPGLTGGGVSGDPLRASLALMPPGTALRDGLERILRGRTGALIVLGYDKVVEAICTGGFPLDVEFSATRLRELCKMDGAVVLSSDGTRIVRADRKSTRLNSSHANISYAVFCLKKKKETSVHLLTD